MKDGDFRVIFLHFLMRRGVIPINAIDDLKSLTDEELLGGFKEGNEKCFDELYFRYAARLKRLILFYTGNEDESDDILHDVFMRVYRHVDTFQTERVFSSWIYRIAVNCSKNFRRKQRKMDSVIMPESSGLEEAVNPVSPEDMFVREEEQREFYRGVEGLKDKFKTVFLLRFTEGLSYKEISRVLKSPERTVKWRMQKAIESIADHLKKKGVV